MKFFAAFVLFLFPLFLSAQENSETPDTVLIHPGETLYITFQRTTDDVLAVARISKDKDKAAQIILKMNPVKETHGTMLQVENKFDKNLHYKAEMRLLSRNKKAYTSVVPVIAGKLSFESWPFLIEELALSGFELKDR